MPKKREPLQPVIDQAAIDALLSGISQADAGEAEGTASKVIISDRPTDVGAAKPADTGPSGRRTTVSPVEFTPFSGPTSSESTNNIDLLLDVVLNLTVELGRSRMTVKSVLGLGPGLVVVLDKLAGEPVDISVNGTFIARGEVVVVDEKFGVRVTEIVSPAKRVASVA